MAKEQDRDKEAQPTTKPNERDKKLTDLTADEKDKDVKGGGGKIGTTDVER